MTWPTDPDERINAIDATLRDLVLKGYIECRVSPDGLQYRITELGMKAVAEGREKFQRDNPEFR